MNTSQQQPVGLSARHTPLPGTEPLTPQETEEQLVEAIGDSRDVLVRATTVFPLTMFPDTITLDRTKLTITHRDFFKSAEVMSFAIEDILSVTATVGPFFGSVKITTRFFDPSKTHTVHHFWRGDALKLKRIAQGYVIAHQKGVDCSGLSNQELRALLDDLGKVATPEKV